MNKKKLLSFAIALLLGVSSTFAQKQPVDYVNPLMGTDSKISLSNGNTYPAIALPWGMNFWMPQTGKMGDGWAYTYASDKISDVSMNRIYKVYYVLYNTNPYHSIL